MKLRYLTLQIRPGIVSDSMEKEFNQRVEYICYFITIKMRRLRFETDANYRHIHIRVGSDKAPSIVPDRTLEVGIPFSMEAYTNSKNCLPEYYVARILEGLTKAGITHQLPLLELKQIIQEFRSNGYQNNWLYFKRKIRQHGLSVEMTCSFTEDHYQMEGSFFSILDGTLLCKGIVARTKPDPFYFSSDVSKVIIKGDEIRICDKLQHELIAIDLVKARTGEICRVLLPCPNPEMHLYRDVYLDDLYREMQSDLSYGM